MNGLIIFIATVFCLWIGKSLFIPLLIATFLWYLLNALAAYYRRILPCYKLTTKYCNTKSHHIFVWISNILSLSTIFLFVYLFATQINPMLVELYHSMPVLQHKLLVFSEMIANKFDIQIDLNLLPNLPHIATYIGTSVAGIATSIGMIIIYLLFMFVEQGSFGKKINSITTAKIKSKKLHYILNSIDENMKKYLFTKTFISFATGLCSYIVLSILGLEYASVWAFIIFILNYIPTIGSILACALPISYALISGGNSWHLPILVAISLIIIQIVFGNILDPKITGKTLNLSTLAILINLVFWGMLWGPAGMFFSVPILVAIYIITAQFDSTRWIAVLLSANGIIPDKTQND